MLEASVMGQFENPNVIQLKGVVSKCEWLYIYRYTYIYLYSSNSLIHEENAKENQKRIVFWYRGKERAYTLSQLSPQFSL